jgi:hypothetical protein
LSLKGLLSYLDGWIFKSHPFYSICYFIGKCSHLLWQFKDFISFYKFHVKSNFHRFIQKLYEFRVVVNMNDICMYSIYFKYLNKWYIFFEWHTWI